MKILTSEQMASIDRRAIDEYGIPSIVLMENAASAVADVIERHFGEAEAAALFCGIGNNGGDEYGYSKQTEVKVRIIIADNELKFWTKNGIYRNAKKNPTEKGGIGLANVQKRLDIQYPEKYTLKIESDEKTYEVFLQLPLENAGK